MPMELNAAANLRRWQESQQPQHWVESHQGQWDHAAWETLLEDLRRSEFWPLEPCAVGGVLEEHKNAWSNLRRWRDSGEVRIWIESQDGQWNHEDWLRLLEGLQGSSFWPLVPTAVGRELEHARVRWSNVRRWQESGRPHLWVESQRGQWNHEEWLALLETLRRSEFWPLDIEAVGLALEEARTQWHNLCRWEQSGQPRQWVEAHRGRWIHVDWLCLMEALQHSSFWPLDAAAVGRVLERVTKGYWTVRRWRESGQARAWVESRGGIWAQEEWLALLETLRQANGEALEPGSVADVLEELKRQHWNLRRWQMSEQPRRWVETHGSGWLHSDWLALLGQLRQSTFWPLDPDAVGAVLEELKNGVKKVTTPAVVPAGGTKPSLAETRKKAGPAPAWAQVAA
jgi:hypothetical protein